MWKNKPKKPCSPQVALVMEFHHNIVNMTKTQSIQPFMVCDLLSSDDNPPSTGHTREVTTNLPRTRETDRHTAVCQESLLLKSWKQPCNLIFTAVLWWYSLLMLESSLLLHQKGDTLHSTPYLKTFMEVLIHRVSKLRSSKYLRTVFHIPSTMLCAMISLSLKNLCFTFDH